eukprot:PhM_4_TR15637/c0_g1_i1/m.2709
MPSGRCTHNRMKVRERVADALVLVGQRRDTFRGDEQGKHYSARVPRGMADGVLGLQHWQRDEDAQQNNTDDDECNNIAGERRHVLEREGNVRKSGAIVRCEYYRHCCAGKVGRSEGTRAALHLVVAQLNHVLAQRFAPPVAVVHGEYFLMQLMRAAQIAQLENDDVLRPPPAFGAAPAHGRDCHWRDACDVKTVQPSAGLPHKEADCVLTCVEGITAVGAAAHRRICGDHHFRRHFALTSVPCQTRAFVELQKETIRQRIWTVEETLEGVVGRRRRREPNLNKSTRRLRHNVRPTRILVRAVVLICSNDGGSDWQRDPLHRRSVAQVWMRRGVGSRR